MSEQDEFERWVTLTFRCSQLCSKEHHGQWCPAYYRPAVAAALRDAAERARAEGWQEGIETAADYLDQMETIVGYRPFRHEAKAIRALKPTEKEQGDV